jgi:hypothetical protein
MNEQLNLINTPSTAKPRRPKTMSPAALAANRANAQRSTGPRTPAGKLKAASNSLKHGLYAMQNFDNFIADHDQALAVATNYIEQFNPVTPTEVTLVHQLIHMQLRFLQMEYLYGHAMRFRIEDILAKPVHFLPAIMRELDRLPARIQRTIKILRTEIAQREAFIGHGENVEIEPIADAPKLPSRPESEVYHAIETEKGDVPIERLPQVQALAKTDPQAGAALAKQIIADFVDKMNAKHGITAQPASQPPTEPTPEPNPEAPPETK